MIRNIFRLAEYIGGRDGVLLSVEWPFLVFDTLLMAATMGIFYWGYPTMFMAQYPAPGSSHEMLPSWGAAGTGHLKEESHSPRPGVRGRITRGLRWGS